MLRVVPTKFLQHHFEGKQSKCVPLFFTKITISLSLMFITACKSSIDMAFVMDMSGSVGWRDFDKAKRFVARIVNNFTIAANRTRVGLITYSTWPFLRFGLDRFDNGKDVSAAIEQTRFKGGMTHTGKALRLMLDKIFNQTEKASTQLPTTEAPTTAMETTPPPPPVIPGLGPDIGVVNRPRPVEPTTILPTTQTELVPMEIKSRVAIVVTDGRAQDDVLPPSLEAHRLGITVFAIGVGNRIKLSELREIASDPDQAHIYTVGDYTAIDSIRASVRQRSCLGNYPQLCLNTLTDLSLTFEVFEHCMNSAAQ